MVGSIPKHEVHDSSQPDEGHYPSQDSEQELVVKVQVQVLLQRVQ